MDIQADIFREGAVISHEWIIIKHNILIIIKHNILVIIPYAMQIHYFIFSSGKRAVTNND